MLPDIYPEINIYWSFDKHKLNEYKKAFSKLVVGQLNTVGKDTVGVVIVEGVRKAIPIVVDDGYAFSQLNTRFSTASLITDDYYPVIFLEKVYYEYMNTKPIVRTNIYHEIGHLYMKHINRNPNTKNDIENGRSESYRKGEVFWQEREADAFACHYVGKEKMVNYLCQLKKLILSIPSSDKFFTNRSAYLTETEKRIALIQQL